VWQSQLVAHAHLGHESFSEIVTSPFAKLRTMQAGVTYKTTTPRDDKHFVYEPAEIDFDLTDNSR
jgi:hypothetical protein